MVRISGSNWLSADRFIEQYANKQVNIDDIISNENTQEYVNIDIINKNSIVSKERPLNQQVNTGRLLVDQLNPILWNTFINIQYQNN